MKLIKKERVSDRVCHLQRCLLFLGKLGEERRESGEGLRVVRVGTHLIKNGGSNTKLWERLKAHKGTKSGSGNHRGSVFRLLVGQALWNVQWLSPNSIHR